MKPFAGIGLSFVVALTMGCDEKKTECEAVVTSMRSLGRKLAAAQKVTSNKSAKVVEVAAALRPFAEAAKSTGETLASSALTIPELRQIADDAAEAATELSESATKMADAAERMKGIEAARRAVNIRKTFVDTGEAKLHELCTPATPECAALSKVLFDAPLIPETADDSNAKQAWAAKVNAWASELASVRLTDATLMRQTASLIQAWKAFASAMTTLATLSDAARELETAAQSFSEHVNAAKAAMNAATNFCKG